jgi:hypothetical protein
MHPVILDGTLANFPSFFPGSTHRGRYDLELSMSSLSMSSSIQLERTDIDVAKSEHEFLTCDVIPSACN